MFTSDHGEYGASHGLRGKGASAYEEAIRVPLIVKDPRGVLTARARAAAHAADLERRRRAAAADDRQRLERLAPAKSTTRTSPNGSTSPSILADPDAPGRPFVLHATDETVTEFAIEPYAADAPLHVVAMRTPKREVRDLLQLAVRRDRAAVAAARKPSCMTTAPTSGRLELQNSVGSSDLEEGLRAEYRARLRRGAARAAAARGSEPAHARGFADYFSTARHAATAAAARRKRRAEEGAGPSEQEAHRARPRGAAHAAPEAFTAAETPSTAPEASSACDRDVGPAGARRQRDRRLKAAARGALAAGASAAGVAPPSTRQEATSVAPFQLA